MKTMLKFVLLFVMLGVGISAQAQVILMPPGVDTNPDGLSVDFHRVNVKIDNQIAITEVSMQFTNNGEGLAEGTFLFPLPPESAVDNLTMTINGQVIEANLLRADEARAIYDEIVRQYRDPALLEYVGRDVIQASVFPIPAGESRKIDIRYGQALALENGLLSYRYPLNANPTTSRSVKQVSIRVEVTDDETLSNVYSPSYPIAISRPSDSSFVAGFEANDFTSTGDFQLYYGVRREDITASLLTYKASSDEDGFFMLMLQPPLSLSAEAIQPKDVVIVLDQSGSMEGTKWEQAQEAATYVLGNLNPNDRFNVIAFSTGWRVYSETLLPASDARPAIAWVKSLYAEGGTDINGGLTTALNFTDDERLMAVLFMTDGLATEGITYTPDIIESLNSIAKPNARIFTFGVGDDVDTFLLDSVANAFNGLGTYVRPYESIEDEVASLYNKISSPVLSDLVLTIDGITTQSLYPVALPDLFAGEQVTVVGQYRRGTAGATVTLTGNQNGQTKTYTYSDLAFNDRANGTEFISRLWATRRIGDLLNKIRLEGETQELVDSVVSLSIRYGIITPYTSFLITEDDILTQAGQDRANVQFQEEAQGLAESFTGSGAVDAADLANSLQRSANAAPPPSPLQAQSAPATAGSVPNATQNSLGGVVDSESESPAEGTDFAEPSIQQNLIQNVGQKTFIQPTNGIWTDTSYLEGVTPVQDVEFLSDEYFDLLEQFPELAPYLAIGQNVLVVLGGNAYNVTTP